MTKQIDTSMFWDINRTLTHNCLFHFIVGNRGGGKTYGCSKKAIDNNIDKEKAIKGFIEHKQQFGYIRRYKDDLAKAMPKFFKPMEDKYPDYEFKVDGDKFYIRLKPQDEEEKWTDEDIAGYGFSLSTAGNLKSVAYPYITFLMFDEFLLDKGNQHYLPNEPEKLLNLYETIARPGTGHPRVVLFLLANAISITNPYFLYFGLRMPQKQDKNGKWIWKHPTKPILVEDVRNEHFIDIKSKTEFGKLVAGTKYADYSIDNKFFLDDSRFIEKRSPKATHYCNFIYKERTFGVWVSYSEGRFWVSDAYDPSCVFRYSLTLQDHSPNTLFIRSVRNTRFKAFIQAYKDGCVRFETMDIKNLTYEVIQMVLN